MLRKHFVLPSVMVSWYLLFALLAVSSSQAQNVSSVEDHKNTEWHSVYDFLLGEPAQDSIYLGMWSYHFIDDDDDYTNTHNLFGLVYKGIFLGTFLNSHEDRAWALGLQRDVYRTKVDMIDVDIGYRFGLMHGYDNLQLFDSELFPLLQVYSDLSYEKLGIQFSWAGTVITAGFFIRF